jgi:hypothetical protein
MKLGERVRVTEAFGSLEQGSEGVVIGFVRNGRRPDAIVAFADREATVVPVSKLSAAEDEPSS